jgi:hypothetical protein
VLPGWVAVSHGLACIGVLHLPLDGAAIALLLAVLAAHAYWRWPRPVGRIVRSHDGSWALPDAGRTGLRLAPATRYGDWWADLRLTQGHGCLRVLLCRDQLSVQAWRVLQMALRSEAGRPGLS